MASFAPALLQLPPKSADEAEQLNLFADSGPNVSQLRAAAAALTRRARATSTRRAYDSDWRIFTGWCEAAGRSSLPATPDTVLCFVAGELQERKPATVERRLASIAQRHKSAKLPSPVTSEVRDALAGWCRQHGREQRQAHALTAEDVGVIAATCDESPREVRDRLILLMGFATGMRRSELAGLELRDLDITREGVLVRIRRGKTDQEGHGRCVPLHPGRRGTTDPLYWLSRYLELRGRWPGSLFVQTTPAGMLKRQGLSGRGVGEVVKRLCSRVGLQGRYTAHSLRAGLVTHSLLEGAPEALVMAVTGHRSHSVLAQYARPAKVLRIDLLKGAM